jgi:hypothetical protein
MTAARDPAWIGWALKAYGACLWLYPRALREAHGNDMRQAFRDRCREVARGERAAWRTFLAELTPDLLASVARAQADDGRSTGDARVLPGLLLLALLATALATQPRWSPIAADGIHAVGHGIDVIEAAREMNHQRDFVRQLTASLQARGDAESMAVAALLQREVFDQRSLPWPFWEAGQPVRVTNADAGATATALAAPIVTGGAPLAALSIAVQACSTAAGCNEDMAIGRLLARDPDNAIPWMLAFKRAARRGDTLRMQAAVDGVARARYADSHMADVQRALFREITTTQAGDARAFADALDHFRATQWALADDFVRDLRLQCSLRPHGDSPRRWVETHPDSRPACIHLAGLLAASTDAWASSYGWRQLRLAGVALTPERIAAMRDASWLAGRATRVGGDWAGPGTPFIPWSLQDWTRWNTAWAPGDGELPAVRRWLQASGKPVHAPPGFDAWPAGG